MEEKVRAFGDEVYVGCHRKKKTGEDWMIGFDVLGTRCLTIPLSYLHHHGCRWPTYDFMHADMLQHTVCKEKTARLLEHIFSGKLSGALSSKIGISHSLKETVRNTSTERYMCVAPQNSSYVYFERHTLETEIWLAPFSKIFLANLVPFKLRN